MAESNPAKVPPKVTGYRLVWWPDGKGGKVCWYEPEFDDPEYVPPPPKEQYLNKTTKELERMQVKKQNLREKRGTDGLIDGKTIISIDHPDAHDPRQVIEKPYVQSAAEKASLSIAVRRCAKAGFGASCAVLAWMGKNRYVPRWRYWLKWNNLYLCWQWAHGREEEYDTRMWSYFWHFRKLVKFFNLPPMDEELSRTYMPTNIIGGAKK